jgi:hypothetical protein
MLPSSSTTPPPSLLTDQTAQGILSRLYYTHSIYPSTNSARDVEIDRVRRALEKHFPRTDKAKQEKGFDRFVDPTRAKQMVNELSNLYSAVRDAARWKDITLETIKQFSSNNNKSTSVTTNKSSLYLSSFECSLLDLITTYTRVALLTRHFQLELRTLVALYNAAYNASYGKDEETFSSVSSFISKFATDSCVKNLAAELNVQENLVFTITSALTTISTSILTNKDFTGNCVDILVLNNTPTSADAPTSPSYIDPISSSPLLLYSRARSWLIFSLLACPLSLTGPVPANRSSTNTTTSTSKSKIEPALRKILSEIVTEPIFRCVGVRVHEEIWELYNGYPPKPSPTRDWFKEVLSMKPKKLVTEAAVEATNRGAIIHRDRRIILIRLLTILFHHIQHDPGLLGPKLTCVLSALSCSRDELIWYFMHLPSICAPPKIMEGGIGASVIGVMSFGLAGGQAADAKYRADEWIDDSTMSLLLNIHMKLFFLAKKWWWIAEHFVHDLATTSDGGKNTTIKFGQYLSSTTINTQTQLKELLDGAITTTSTAADVWLINLVLKPNHTGLHYFASLSDLQFLPSQALSHLILDEVIVKPETLLSFFDLWTFGSDATHPLCLDEYSTLRSRILSSADSVLAKITDKLDYALDLLAKEKSRLESQVDPIRAADRLHKLRELKLGKKTAANNNIMNNTDLNNNPTLTTTTGGGGGGPTTTNINNTGTALGNNNNASHNNNLDNNLLLNTGGTNSTTIPQLSNNSLDKYDLLRLDKKPGFESKPGLFEDRTVLSKLEQYMETVQILCGELGRKLQNTVIVWDRAYLLREFLRDTLNAWLDRRIRDACVHFRGGMIPSNSNTTTSSNPNTGTTSIHNTGGGGATLQRPSILLQEVNIAFWVICYACLHGSGLDPHILWRNTMQKEIFNSPSTFIPPSYGSNTTTNIINSTSSSTNTNATSGNNMNNTSGHIPDMDFSKSTLAQMISGFLCGYIDRLGASSFLGIVYSPFTKGFVKVSELEMKAGGPQFFTSIPKAEMWLDMVEMRSLLTFLGPRGAQILERSLGMKIRASADVMRFVLADDDVALSQSGFKKNVLLGEIGVARLARSSVKGSNTIFNHLRMIGIGLMFRKMIREALTQVPGKRDVDLLLKSSSMIAGGNNGDLWSSNRDLLSVFSDTNFANNLTLAVAASMVGCESWKSAEFLLRLDAFANNVHLIAFATCEILKLITPIPKNLRKRELDFLAAVCAMLLDMKRDQEKEFKDWPLRALFQFPQKIVEYSTYLKMADLEKWLPYSMLVQAQLDIVLGRNRFDDVGLSPREFAMVLMEDKKRVVGGV